MRKTRKLLSAVLAVALIFSMQTPLAVFAEDGTYKVTYSYSGELPASVKATLPEDGTLYEDGAVVTAKTPSSMKVVDNKTVYTFSGWDAASKTIEGADISFTGSWSSKDVVYKIDGKAVMHPYGSSSASGTPLAGETITLSLASSNVNVTTDSEGKFSYTFTDKAQIKDSGEYTWSIAANDTHYAASGTAKDWNSEGSSFSNSLSVEERFSASASDFEYVESENLKKINGTVWVRSAGTHKIKAKGQKKLSSTLDGTASDTLDITVDTAGKVSPFYVYDGDKCSKVMNDQTVSIDAGAPVINTVSSEAADGDTYVKAHGIYGKTKASLVLTADITEDTSISEAYLVRIKDGESARYDKATVTAGDDGTYSVEIPLPEDETILDAELVKLVVKDSFGNASNEALLRTEVGEDGSKVTLEQIAPSISDKNISGKKSSYDWYSEMPVLSASASDNLSGLASFRIKGETGDIAKADENDLSSRKITDSRSISGTAAMSAESADGSYVYTIEAADNSGNIATEDVTVMIDLVAPKIEAEGAKSGEHYRKNPEISITEDEKYYAAKGNRIFVNVTRDGRTTTFDRIFEQVNEAKIPASAFAIDGNYKVTIFAKDAADNDSETISYEFVKDATAPVVSISGVKNGKFYNKKQTVSVTVKEHNFATNNVSVSAVKKLGNATKNMGFPWTNKAEETTNSKTFSETGTYTITASAKDKAGNESGTKKISFTVDTKAPEITITGVKDGGVYTYGEGLAPKATVKDDYLASKSIVFTKGGERISDPSFAQLKENDGLYTMTVTATDKAGNSSRKQISFTVNRFGSYFEYSDAVKALMGKAVQNVDGDLVITEKNISRVINTQNVITRDGKSADNASDTDESGSAGGYTYKHIFPAASFSEEGKYEINVISRDEVGNEMESREENGKVTFFVDRTAPSLTVDGIDPKGINAESATLTVNVNDLLTGISEVKATVDGKEVALSEADDGVMTFDVGEGLRQEIKVTAADGAGNEAVFEDDLSVSASSFKLWFDRLGKFFAGGLGALALLAGAGFFIAGKRKKDDEEEEAGSDQDSE